MNIEKLLLLERTVDTVYIIKSFLDKNTISLQDYRRAVFFMQEILLENHKLKEAIEVSNSVWPKFKEAEEKDYLLFLTNWFWAYLRSSSAINAREIFSKIKEKYGYSVDFDLVYLETNLLKLEQKFDSEKVISELKKPDLPETYARYYLKELVSFFVSQNKLDLAYDYLNQANSRFDERDYEQELKLLFALGWIDELKQVLKDCKGLGQYKVISQVYHYCIAVSEQNNHRADIIQSEYEKDILKLADNDLILMFLEAQLKFFKANSQRNNEEKTAKRIAKFQQKKDKTTKLNLDEEPVISLEEVTKPNLEVKEKGIKVEAKVYQNFFDIMIFYAKIPQDLSLRETLRSLLIKSEALVPAADLVILNNQTLYNYKKERLYNKEIEDIQLTDTVFSKLHQVNLDKIYQQGDLSEFKNPLTGSAYAPEYQTLYCFSLGKNLKFVVQSHNFQESEYSYFKLLSALILDVFEKDKTLLKLKQITNLFTTLKENSTLAFKYYVDEQVHLSAGMRALLDGVEITTLDQYCTQIAGSDKISYKKEFLTCSLKPGNSLKQKYRLRKKQVMELASSVDVLGKVVVFSLVLDIDEEQNTINTLAQTAKVNNIYGLFSHTELERTFQSKLIDKFSLILIELNFDNRHLYSLELQEKYIAEFIDVLKEFFNTDALYFIQDNKFALFVDFNDIRALSNVLSELSKKTQNVGKQNCLELTFLFTASALRYPTATYNKTFKKIYRFADLALNLAKTNGKVFHIFEKEDLHQDIFEDDVIKLILNYPDKLKLMLLPIVDKNKNVVLYQAGFSLDGYDLDFKEIKEIAKKHRKTVEIDTILFKEVVNALNIATERFGQIFDVLLPVCAESLLSQDFKKQISKLKYKYLAPHICFLFPNEEELPGIVENFKQSLEQSKHKVFTKNISAYLRYGFQGVVQRYADGIRFTEFIKMFALETKKTNSYLIVKDLTKKEEFNSLKKIKDLCFQGKLFAPISVSEIFSKMQESQPPKPELESENEIS